MGPETARGPVAASGTPGPFFLQSCPVSDGNARRAGSWCSCISSPTDGRGCSSPHHRAAQRGAQPGIFAVRGPQHGQGPVQCGSHLPGGSPPRRRGERQPCLPQEMGRRCPLWEAGLGTKCHLPWNRHPALIIHGNSDLLSWLIETHRSSSPGLILANW